jgi:hypothetical protein
VAVAARETPVASKPTIAKVMPRTSTIAGRSASSRSRPAPTVLTPAASKYSRVWTTPLRPWSPMWFEPSVATSTPWRASRSATRGSIEKTVPLLCCLKPLIIGHSKSVSVRSAPCIRSRTAPSLPVRAGLTTGQPLPSGPLNRVSM